MDDKENIWDMPLIFLQNWNLLWQSPIFVNFGPPPHDLGMKKYTKKRVNLCQKAQKRPKYRVLNAFNTHAKQYTGLKNTAGAGGGIVLSVFFQTLWLSLLGEDFPDVFF